MSARVKSEDTWEAESDFRTLANAEEIKGNPTKLRKAKTAGKRLVKEEQKALQVKQRVAGKTSKKSGGRKRR